MAVLRAHGLMGVGDEMAHASPIGSTFEGRIVEETTVDARPAIVPAIRRSAWITGISQVFVEQIAATGFPGWQQTIPRALPYCMFVGDQAPTAPSTSSGSRSSRT